jgi:endonuclease G
MWRILEEQIRKWALKEQELYIITGPIIRPNHKTIGPNKVTVPQWYYKIIVDYHQPEIKALAFMIPNRKPQKSLQSFAVSIDKLEEVTHLDFLNLLPQKVQTQLESKVNLSPWKLPAAKAGKSERSKVSKSKATTGGKYWISSTNKRHNSSCRYYQKSKGQSGGESEGVACKICGG